MAYIGTSPSNGVRRRFVYVATANQTSFSGNDENNISLVYVDVAYLDVYQNGVKLKAVDDYASTTGTSVVLVQGASADDVVEIIAFDVFSIGDTVSAKDGGSFGGNIGMGGTLAVTGAVTANAGVVVDEMTLDGDTLTATDTFTIDAVEDITLDAASTLVRIKHNGTQRFIFNTDATPEIDALGGDFTLHANTSDADIILKGNDGGATITALTIDMSEGGRTSLNAGASFDISGILIYSTVGSGGIAIQTTPSANHAYVPMKYRNSSGSEIGTIACSTSGTAYNTSSDHRLKENVSYSFDATTRLKQLKPARFNFILDADTTVDGFIAHEVSSIVPEAITGAKDATESMTNVVLNADGTRLTDDVTQEKWVAGKANETYASDTTWVASQTVPKYQGIDQSKLVPLLVKALQELSEKVETLTLHSSVLEQEAGYHLDNLILDGTNGSSADAGDDIILG